MRFYAKIANPRMKDKISQFLFINIILKHVQYEYTRITARVLSNRLFYEIDKTGNIIFL